MSWNTNPSHSRCWPLKYRPDCAYLWLLPEPDVPCSDVSFPDRSRLPFGCASQQGLLGGGWCRQAPGLLCLLNSVKGERRKDIGELKGWGQTLKGFSDCWVGALRAALLTSPGLTSSLWKDDRTHLSSLQAFGFVVLNPRC